MKVLVDTNVVLDVLLDRQPFSLPAAALLSLVEKKTFEAALGATTLTTIHYLFSKAAGKKKADGAVSKLLGIFEIAAVDASVLDAAIRLALPDFEDAVLVEAARNAGADAIVTRDLTGFKKSDLPAYSPEEFLAALEST